ncbi:MAG: AmmeMemoRadiSam system radical SAM enzyme [Methanomicrobium sp.]|nr:AmmeMemoRadiSam system radical SAM enzyme [Methanomicrobium sp.]
MHEARLYERKGDCSVDSAVDSCGSKSGDSNSRGSGSVVCRLCSHGCVIKSGGYGICGLRYNKDGVLYAENYGRVAVEAVDPIEKKPLYHFLPGTKVYSLGGVGCNFRCRHCQNWEISQCTTADSLHGLSPQKAVFNAVEHRCKSIAFTYNEPALWHEFAVDIGIAAHEEGLKAIYVTNGYLTEDAVRDLKGIIDAFRVDIKAFNDDFYRKVCGGRLQPVLDSTSAAKDCGMHIEVVNLIIPTLNDSESEIRGLCEWVCSNIGENTPIHFTRFHPDYELTNLPATPLATLEKAYSIAKDAGLKYPYLGNVAGHAGCDTFCPKCGALLIKRDGYRQNEVGLVSEGSTGDGITDRCRNCGEVIPLVR